MPHAIWSIRVLPRGHVCTSSKWMRENPCLHKNLEDVVLKSRMNESNNSGIPCVFFTSCLAKNETFSFSSSFLGCGIWVDLMMLLMFTKHDHDSFTEKIFFSDLIREKILFSGLFVAGYRCTRSLVAVGHVLQLKQNHWLVSYIKYSYRHIGLLLLSKYSSRSSHFWNVQKHGMSFH